MFILILFSISIIVFFLLLQCFAEPSIEQFTSKYYKCPKYGNTRLLNDVLNNHDIGRTKNKKDWDLYIPCGYNNAEKELTQVKPRDDDQKIYAIKGCDKIVSKNNLWSIIHNTYGRKVASLLMPDTYLMYDASDMTRFKKQYKPGDVYLLKKNVQRKEGIHITNDLDDIMSKQNTDYRVVQKYIPDLYLIQKRKINLRIYLLIVCRDTQVRCYMHKKGKCIYTNKDFKDPMGAQEKEPNFDREIHLTSVNLDKNVYNTRPHNLEELRIHLGEQAYYTLMDRIVENLIAVMKASKQHICTLASLNKNTTFQLFGLDYVFDDQLHPYLLEMNKGPEMSVKHDKDEPLKTQVLDDAFKTSQVVEDDNNNDFFQLKV